MDEIAADLGDSVPGTTKMLTRVEGPVGWMVFNNPLRRNAVSSDMWAAIPGIVDRFEQDPAIRVIALTGAGRQAFVSGADISQFERQRSSAASSAAYDHVFEQAVTALRSATKPTVAVIRGWCLGGGVGIAVTCDLRFAAEDARFGVPAARLGLGYAMRNVKTLMDLVGPANTKEIFYTARHFTAAEALDMGLINRAVPADQLEAFVAAQFASIAANAPLTLLALKRAVAELGRGQEADYAAVDTLVQACFDSADYAEGRRAFMDKRKPVFKGV